WLGRVGMVYPGFASGTEGLLGPAPERQRAFVELGDAPIGKGHASQPFGTGVDPRYELGNLVRGNRSTKQVALAAVTAELAQAIALAWLFDPFGDDRKAQRSTKGDDGVRARPVVVAASLVRNRSEEHTTEL